MDIQTKSIEDYPVKEVDSVEQLTLQKLEESYLARINTLEALVEALRDLILQMHTTSADGRSEWLKSMGQPDDAPFPNMKERIRTSAELTHKLEVLSLNKKGAKSAEDIHPSDDVA